MADVDTVRLIINDPADGSGNPKQADPSTPVPFFTDPEITTFLNFHGDEEGDYARVQLASSDLIRAIASRFAQFVRSRSIGGTYTEDARQVVNALLKIADDLKQNAISRPEVDCAQMNFADNPFSDTFICMQKLADEWGDE